MRSSPLIYKGQALIRSFKYQPRNPGEMKRMTPQQKALMLAEQQADFHSKAFESGEDAEFHARCAIDALITLGEFEQARRYTDHCDSGYGEILEASDAACGRDDTERCDCENPTISRVEGGVEMGVEESPRYIIERAAIYNPYRDRIDSVYRCHICGDIQALPDHPDQASAQFHAALKVA
jgi:hypothetical protein